MSDTRSLAPVNDARGRRIYVEISDTSPSVVLEPGGGLEPATAATELAEYFESLEEAIQNTCDMVYAGITRLATAAAPSKVNAEFSLELGMEGKVWFIAKGNAKAALKVNVEWDLSGEGKSQQMKKDNQQQS